VLVLAELAGEKITAPALSSLMSVMVLAVWLSLVAAQLRIAMALLSAQ
jgi:hypothetical protein